MATFVPDLFRKAEELNNQLAGVVSAIKKNNEYLQRKPNDKVLLDMDSRLQNLMKELTESQSFLFAEMRKMGVRPATENPEYRKEKFDRQVCHFYHKLNNNNIKLSKLLLDLQVIKLDATGKPNQRKHLVNNGNSLNGGTVVVNGHLSGPHDDDEDHHRGSSSNEELGSSQQLNGLGLRRLPPKNGLRKKVSLAATGNVKLGRKRKRKEDSFDLVPEITQATALSGGSSPIEEEEDADADLQMLVPGSVKVSASNSEASSRSPSPGFLGQEAGDPKLRFMHAVGLFGFDEIPDLLAKVKKDARRKVKCSRRAEYDYSKTVAERKANAARWEKTESLRKKVRTPLAAVKAVTNGDTKYEMGRPSTSAERKLLHKVGGVTIKVATCVACNKPGSVLQCAKCEKYFHVTCHTVDPPSSKWCQDCIGTIKRRVKNKTLTGAASYSSRPFGGACSDSEFYRPDAGLYNVDAVGAGQYLTGAAFGYNQLPSSTFLIPISNDNDAATGPQRPKRPTAASVAAAAAASGRDVTVTAVTNSSSLSTSFPLSSSSPAVVRPNVRVGKHRQSSILLNQLTQPAVLNVSPNSPFHGVSGQSRWQRWSSDRPSIPSEVSILDWSESRATARPLEQPNYHEVTVELVCNDRNDDDVVVEDDGNRSDEGCVYLEENDSRDRACDDDGNPVDSDDPDEVKQQQAEPEVLNVSSGSSEIQSCLSPSAIKRKRDTSIETIKPSTPPSKRRRVGCDNTRKDFLRSIFPGRYGFKIDIYDDDNDLSSSYSSSSELRDDDEDEQSNDRREHLKLEEAHLSAPPESDLMIILDGEEDDDEETKRMTLDEDENSCSSSSSSVQQLDSNAVPDNNKSDDVVMENKREEDGDCER
ncbi:uncharacterized protein LOC106647507 isoform X2 [Copidosoma floridanum]|uniref:uncharacterized protein LOC106647507 isoform X2 n=1 Tax=Copidosoma floridanum TaxID=29053 RepID=UPI0006C9A2DA|nr:uncharacterized protein LOC106647507 isoform X2 [Copidosoma floridanum]